MKSYKENPKKETDSQAQTRCQNLRLFYPPVYKITEKNKTAGGSNMSIKEETAHSRLGI